MTVRQLRRRLLFGVVAATGVILLALCRLFFFSMPDVSSDSELLFHGAWLLVVFGVVWGAATLINIGLGTLGRIHKLHASWESRFEDVGFLLRHARLPQEQKRFIETLWTGRKGTDTVTINLTNLHEELRDVGDFLSATLTLRSVCTSGVVIFEGDDTHLRAFLRVGDRVFQRARGAIPFWDYHIPNITARG